MRLEDVRDSDNVEDRRGSGLTVRRGAIGGGTIVVAIVLALLGAPRSVIQSLLTGGSDQATPTRQQIDPAQAPQKAFVTKILGETEDVWGAIFQQEHASYERPHLVLFSDCLAGVWAHHSGQLHNTLQPGDIDEGLRAASAIGDDTLQKQARGYVVPESFTHGSSAQRVQWFKRGFDKGDLHDCATSAATKI